MQEDLCRAACQLIQRLMEAYISGDPERIAGIFPYLSPDILVIGTGKHEFYKNFDSLISGLEKDQEEARGIRFIIKNEWFDAKLVSEDTCVVYGEFEAGEANAEGKELVINMETRITSTVHREPDGRLIIDSLHQSAPYIYQEEGEYYPKTFTDRAEEAIRRSAVLERDVQLDSMTGLFNRKFTECHISRMLSEEKADGFLFLLDLDEFKLVNDIHGHQAGDALLKRISAVLGENIRSSDIGGRMGGDEFMLFFPGQRGEKEGEQIAVRLIEETRRVFAEMNLGQSCSVGIAAVRNGDLTFEEAYRRADKALYCAKAKGKGTYSWYREKQSQME